MKLGFRIISLFFLFFFIKINNVLAGIYYDVTNITKEGNYIKIEGWAIAHNKGMLYHQVNPQFYLYIVDSMNSKNNLIGPINSSAAYGAFDNSDINNPNSTFFSAAYYYQAKGYLTLQGYWAKANDIMEFRKLVTTAIKETSGWNNKTDHGNRIMVNNHFEFKIKIEGEGGLKDAFSKASIGLSGRRELSLKLKIIQGDRCEDVYGQTFDLPLINEEITSFAATKSVINENVKKIMGMELTTDYNAGEVIVSQGFLQKRSIQSSYGCSCLFNNNECTKPYPTSGGYEGAPWAKFNEGQTYTFYGRAQGDNQFIRATPPYKLGMYDVRVYISSQTDKDCRISDGGPNGPYYGYLPSVWIKPPAGIGSLMSFVQTCVPWECEYYKDDKITCGAPKTKTFYFPNDPNSKAPEGAEPPWCESHCREDFEAGKVVYEDSTCTISCNEQLHFEVNRPEEVISGMGLSYPIKLIGERVCKSSSSSLSCVNWFKTNKYEPKPTIEVNITMPGQLEKEEQYVRVANEQIVKKDEIKNNKIIETTNIEFTYDFPYRYLEPYSGEYVNGDIPHGHYFYIDRDHPTGTYDIDLKITDFGPLDNLKFKDKEEKYKYDKIIVNCEYKVKNLHWPPTSGIPGFRVRQVSLNDLFPNNRTPGDNWAKEEYQPLISEIEELNYGLYNQLPLYTITLNRASMLDIRRSNFERNRNYGHAYSCFELNERDQSRFIRETLQNWVIINDR